MLENSISLATRMHLVRPALLALAVQMLVGAVLAAVSWAVQLEQSMSVQL